MYLGDYRPGDTLDFGFTTSVNGVPTQLAGTPALRVYKANSTTEASAGITLDVDFDSRTGLNHVRIDTSADGTFYATATDFYVVISAGTVSGSPVVGSVVAHFSLKNRSLRDVETDTQDIQSRLPAALTGAGNLKADALVVSDKTGYALAASGIGAGTFVAAELNAVADAILDRNMATGTDSGSDSTAVRTVRQALRRLRNREEISAGTGTVYKEDDGTPSWTYGTTTAAGDPLTAINPT